LVDGFETASGARPTRRTRTRAGEEDVVRDEPDMPLEVSSPEPITNERTYSSRWAQAVAGRILGQEIDIDTPRPVEEVHFESVTAEQTIDIETNNTYTFNSDMWTLNNWSPVEYEEDRDEELCTEDENPF
jgi:hypothetical protein